MRVEQITQEKLKNAISNVATDTDILMLKAHYNSPNHTISAKGLAREMKFSSLGESNLKYGGFAGKIIKYLEIEPKPEQNLAVLVDFNKLDGEWFWILAEDIIEIIKELGWLDLDYENREVLLPEEKEIENVKFSEGSAKTVSVNKYERNPKARKACLEHYGYSCKICDLKFEDKYGKSAKNFIHVHHIKEISQIGEKYEVDPINDLIPVCPNCHAVIHLAKPIYTIDQVKEMIRKNK